MIITRISGGLGNQMFQYAAGRALALRHKTECLLDVSSYASDYHDAPRQFLLDRFSIAARVAKPADFKTLDVLPEFDQSFLARMRRKLIVLKERGKPLKERRYIVEPGFTFCPEVLEARNNCLISGVWQSQKYFKDFTGNIHQEFKLKDPLSTRAAEVLKQIDTAHGVSIHIRRGDYVSDPHINAKHGTCSEEYYERAIECVINTIKEPSFFIFSDDINWAKEHLPVPSGSIFVSSPEVKDYEELMLMAACRHHIVANSSFSWWGAWLGTQNGSLNIAPSRWFNSGTSDQDIIPESWIRL